MTLRLTLPDGGEGFSLEPNDRRIEVGGYRYDRRTTITNGVVETVYSMASLGPEVSAEAMAEARRRRDRSDSLPPQVRAPLTYATTSAGSARPGDTAAAGTPLEQAQSLAFVGDFAAALAMLDDLIAREPENDEALRYRAAVRREAEDLAGSRADYESALALDPADVEALAGLGVTDLADDRPAEAIVSFSVALRLDPRNVTALTGRGAAYYRIANWARSLDDYRAAKAGEGGGRTGLLGELRALIRLERYDEAREIARAALAENPIESVAIDALVRLEEAAGQPQAALPVLDAALAAVPDDPWFLVQRAAVRARSGDTQGAREDFSRVRTLADGAPPILNALCWRQAVSGFDLEQALADCDEAVASGRPNAQGSRAFVLLWLGRAEEALDLFQALSQDRAIRASSTFGLGLAKLSLGDASGAEDLSRARVMDIDVDEPFRVFLDRHPALAPSRP